jgi:hypothetical protein
LFKEKEKLQIEIDNLKESARFEEDEEERTKLYESMAEKLERSKAMEAEMQTKEDEFNALKELH